MIPNVKGPFTRIQLESINLNSHAQVKDYLYTQGWEPTTWNYNKKTKERTSPKLTEDSFASIKGDTGKLIARRNVLRHRRNTILNFKDDTKGWLNCVDERGRISAGGITCGTPTSRYKHIGIVNVPSPPAPYGEEMRRIFYAKEPYRFLGADLSAIEARILGHYTAQFDGGSYAAEILDGDIHTKNAEMIERDRDTAKTFLYALSH